MRRYLVDWWAKKRVRRLCSGCVRGLESLRLASPINSVAELDYLQSTGFTTDIPLSLPWLFFVLLTN